MQKGGFNLDDFEVEDDGFGQEDQGQQPDEGDDYSYDAEFADDLDGLELVQDPQGNAVMMNQRIGSLGLQQLGLEDQQS